ncbi:MAG: hypothetical protein WBY96_13420 [Candidatus Sulfotelmatobacter sp.]
MRVPIALIVIDLASPNPFSQAEEVIQHVPVVLTDRGGTVHWERASVHFVGHAIQENAALLQNGLGRDTQ